MESLELCESEIETCKTFLQTFIPSSNAGSGNEKDSIKRIDKFESFCFCLTNAEINGEVIDVLHRFLHYKECPSVLVSPLVSFVQKKFLKIDFSKFQLEKCNSDDTELIEYNASNLVNELYKNFELACEYILQHFESQNIKKLLQPCHISVHAVRNRRRKMEDRHVHYTDLNTLFGFDQAPVGQSLFGVFDGHGGTDAANYAASQLVCNLKSDPNLLADPGTALTNAVIKTDADFCAKAKRERLRSGATAVLALIQGVNLTIAWLGDSQVVLCKAGQTVSLVSPHKPDRTDERERIESLGGCVVYFGGWRVNGSLAVSRAIGDCEQKPFISGVPDVDEYEMEGDEEFLILGCDGLWDNVALDEGVKLVCQCVHNGERDTAAHKLVELAKDNKSMDNISVLVVYLDFNGTPTVSNHCSGDVIQSEENQEISSEVDGKMPTDLMQHPTYDTEEVANDKAEVVNGVVAGVVNGVVADGTSKVAVENAMNDSEDLSAVNNGSTEVANVLHNGVAEVYNSVADVADEFVVPPEDESASTLERTTKEIYIHGDKVIVKKSDKESL